MSKEQSKTVNTLVKLLQEEIDISDSLAEKVEVLEVLVGEYKQLLEFRAEREAKLGGENEKLASKNRELEQKVDALEVGLDETAEALQEEWDRARKLQAGDKPILNHSQTIPFDITTPPARRKYFFSDTYEPPARRKYFFSDTYEKHLAWAEGIYNGEGL